MLKKISNIAFYLALTIEIILVILDKSAYIIQYEGQWFRVTFVLFLLKLLLTKLDTKELLTIAAFILLGVISYLTTGRNEIIRIVVFVAACKDIDAQMLFKYLFWGTLAGCVILVILSFFGIGTFSITTDFGRGEITTRYCLGLGHPNGLHCMFWALGSLYLYVYRNSIKWVHLAILFAANIGLFVLTDSRTGFFTMLFTLIMFVIVNTKWAERNEKILLYATSIGIGVSMAFSVLIMCHRVFWLKLKRLDEFLTGRIAYTHMNVTEAKTFFWQPFSARGRDLQTDLGIVKMVYWYGYVPAIIFMALCFALAFIAMREGDKAALVIVTSIILYSVFEGHDVSELLARNYVFFLLGIYWTKMVKQGVIKAEKCTESREAVG